MGGDVYRPFQSSVKAGRGYKVVNLGKIRLLSKGNENVGQRLVRSEQVNRRAENGDAIRLEPRVKSGDVGQPGNQSICREKDKSEKGIRSSSEERGGRSTVEESEKEWSRQVGGRQISQKMEWIQLFLLSDFQSPAFGSKLKG